MATEREVLYTPLNIDEFGEIESDQETVRMGYFMFFGPYTYVSHQDSPNGVIPLAITITVGIIRDKTTGRTCMSGVNQIKFK